MTSPSPSPGTSPRAPRRRRALRWWVIGVLVVANLAVLAVYLGLRRVDDLVGTALREEATQVPEVVEELSAPPVSVSDPLTFLIIGSDSRAGLDDLSDFGDFAGSRADVVMLVQLLPDSGRAQVLSLPRDLWVPIEGHGENRINAAYAFGGAPLMVSTVKAFTGSPVHHYVEIDFAGFQAIVDQVGGITLDFPYPARDAKSGFEIQAGTQTLNGAQALAYARSRSYQELVDGTWRTDGSGDFGRTARQQQVLVAIIDKAARPSTLLEMGDLIGSFARHMAVDSTFADRSVVELGFAMRDLRGSKIERATLPGQAATRGSRSVVVASEPEASQMLAAFRAGAPLSGGVAGETAPPAVQVLNGNGVSGQAAFWGGVLEGKGVIVAGVGDASGAGLGETRILVRPDEAATGEDLARLLGFGVVVTGDLDPGLDAVVTVGLDAVGLSAGGGS